MAPAIRPAYWTGEGTGVGDDIWMSSADSHLLPNLAGLDMDKMQYNGMGNRFASRAEYKRLVYAHGVLAAVAFLAFVPAAAMLAQFTRHRLLRHRASVLRLQVRLELVAVAITTATFILGWIAVGPRRRLTNPHHSIGVALYVLVLAHVATGCCCAQPRADGRRSILGSWIHQWLGRLAALLGLAQVPLGLCLYGAARAFFILYGVMAGILVLLYIVLSYVYDEPNIDRPQVFHPAVPPLHRHRNQPAATPQGSAPSMGEPCVKSDAVEAANKVGQICQSTSEKEISKRQSLTREPVQHISLHDTNQRHEEPTSKVPATAHVDKTRQRTNEPHGSTTASIPIILITRQDEEDREGRRKPGDGTSSENAVSHNPEFQFSEAQPHENSINGDTDGTEIAASNSTKKKKRTRKHILKQPPLPPVEETLAAEQHGQISSRPSSWENIPEHYRLDGDETDVQSASSYLWDAESIHRRANALGDVPKVASAPAPPQPLPPVAPRARVGARELRRVSQLPPFVSHATFADRRYIERGS